jgi:tetratricopeptide (TPR) repeat protein
MPCRDRTSDLGPRASGLGLARLGLVVAVLVTSLQPVVADDVVPGGALDGDLDAQLTARAARLAEHHYRAGSYYRAITYYEELAVLATDPALRELAAIRIATSYHHGRQLADAVERYDRALALVGDPDRAQALRIQRALARAERTFDEPGVEALDVVAAELQPTTTGGAHHVLAQYTLARVQLLAGRTAAAQITAGKLRGSALEPALSRALARASPARRSPWLGLTLSAIVPGAGSVYGGHLVDGLYYFGLTTLAGLGAWEVHASDRRWTDQPVTFYGLATLAAVFYAGSLVQGYVSVARGNQVRALEHRRALWRTTDQPLPLD